MEGRRVLRSTRRITRQTEGEGEKRELEVTKMMMEVMKQQQEKKEEEDGKRVVKGKRGGVKKKQEGKTVKKMKSEVEVDAARKSEERMVEVAKKREEIQRQKEEILEGIGKKKEAVEVENPLLDVKIVEKLFQLYPPGYTDLVNIRQVCKAWHTATLDRWRSLAVLKLVPESTVFRNTEHGGLKPIEFLQRLENPEDPYKLKEKPYSRFKFNGLKLDMSIRNKGLSLQFWQLVGPSMLYLHLNMCEFIEVTPKPFECLVLEKTPKLQEIIITDTGMVEQPYGPDSTNAELRKKHNLSVSRVSVYGGIPLKLVDFLKLFPNMKELTLRNGQAAKYSSSVITLLNNLRKDSRFKKYKLEKLDIKGTYIINNSIINPFMGPVSERWNQLRCNLKTLCLELTPLERADSIFQPLLQANKSVETLELCIVPRYPSSIYHGSDRFQFRQNMDSLTDLRLWGNVIQNFKFLKYMPNLKRLYCNPLCFEKWAGRGKHHQPCTKDLVKNARLGQPFTLQFMEQLHVEHDLSPVCVKKLSEWMPNLKVLKTVLNIATFPLVCKGWPHLKELRVLFGSEVRDEVITGVTEPTTAQGKGTKRKRQPANNVGLIHLKDLNVFSLDSYCDQAQLTDTSVHEGFLKMPSLFTLKICASDQLTSEGENALKAQIPCLRVIRNSGQGPHGDYECCLRKRFIARSNTTGEEEEHIEAEGMLSDDDSENEEESDEDAANEFISDSDDDVLGNAGDNLHGGMLPAMQILPVLFAFQHVVGLGERERPRYM